MTHATRAKGAREDRAVDVYERHHGVWTCRAGAAGTDGALACAVMHCLFRDGKADRDFRNILTCRMSLSSTAQPRPGMGLENHRRPVETIEEFARLVGNTPRTYLRLGYGFSRSRNGAANMHAASCIAAVSGAWRHEGGGAFHNNGAIYHWDRSLIEGTDLIDPSIRMLDQSQIGAILCGDKDALFNGPPVTAMLIQNTNPITVAPDQTRVKQGFARDDLFVCVHEQFMTETAKAADLVLPATMFMEHDDVYQGGGQQHILLGPS